MKLFKKVVDERQELEMLRIERWGFWIMIVVLIAGIIVQAAMGADLRQVLGEYVVLIIGALYIVVRNILSGHWDYHTKPSLKAYGIYSLIGGVFCAITSGAVQYFRGSARLQGNLAQLLPSVLCSFAVGFIACFVLLAVTGEMTKHRRKKLAENFDDDSE